MPILDHAAFDPAAGMSQQRIRAATWRLRIAAVLAAATIFGAHLAVTYARLDYLDAPVFAVDAALAVLVLVAVFTHIAGLERQRRRNAVVQQLATAFSVPRTIEEAARAGAELVVAFGLAPAAVIAVARSEGDRPEGELLGDEARLVPVGVAGYPESLDELDGEGIPAANFTALSVSREFAAGDRWLAPLAPALGERPRVARLPLIQGDELLGALVLVARRRGALGDRGLLQVIAAVCAAALDHARLYEAAFDQARDLEAQDGRRREFMNAISHELRTPLTSIQAFVEMLAEESARSRLRRRRRDDEQLVDSLARGVERLSGLVDDLLRLGRMEEVDDHVEVGPVDVVQVLRSAETILRPAFLQREQALHLAIPDEPLWVRGEWRTLEQILINLLSNANRHTPPAGDVVVRAAASAGSVRIEVQDSGPGIDPDERERIFQPFYRVPKAGAGQVPGAGLGLALARRSTELLGGHIWVDGGETGEGGARFCVELTALPADAVPVAIAPAVEEELAAPDAEEGADASTEQLPLDLPERRLADR